VVDLGAIVIIRTPKNLRSGSQKKWERHKERIVREHKGEKICPLGTWRVLYFPFEEGAREIEQLALECDMDIDIYEVQKMLKAPKKIKQKEIQAQKEIEESSKEFMTAGTEHQKQ